MLRLALMTFRARKGGFVATFVALLLGAAVVGACGILLESGLRASAPPERYAAADAVVAGRQSVAITLESVDGEKYTETPALPERLSIDAEAARRIAQVGGVREVIPDIALPAQVSTADGKPVEGRNDAGVTGHTWSSVRLGAFRLVQGRAPQGGGEVVLDAQTAESAGVRVGGQVRVTAGSTPLDLQVSGIVALRGGPPRQSSIFLSDASVRRLAPVTTVRALGVVAAPGTDTDDLAGRLKAAVHDDGLEVYTGDERGKAEFLDLAVSGSNVVTLAAAVGGNVLLIAVFVIYATTTLAMQHRRRETALLRAVGALPRQIRGMVLAEAAIVASVAGLLGWPLSIGLVYWMRDQFAGHGIVPPDFLLVIGPLPPVAALALTVLTALTAVLAASRRVTRIRPAEALGEAAVENPRLGIGRTITGAVLALAVLSMFGAALGLSGDFTTLVGLAGSIVLLIVITTAVLGPLVARGAMRVLSPVLRTSGIAGYLAGANTRLNARRLAGSITPLILAVAFASTVVFAQTTGLQQTRDEMRDGLLADHIMTSPSGLAPAFTARVRELDGVQAATGLVKSKVIGVQKMFGEGGTLAFTAQGVDPRAAAEVLDLKVEEGSLERLGPHAVALSSTAASGLDVGVGQTAELHLGDGTPFAAEVVAVYERGLGFAEMTFDHDTLLAHTTARRDASVLVRGAPDTPNLHKELARLAARYPGTTVQRTVAVEDRLREQQAYAWVNYLIVGIIIAYTAVTVVNTQVMNTVTRGREFALMRLTGATAGQVRNMMRWETSAVIVAGIGIGTLASAPPLVLIALAVTGSALPSVTIAGYLAIAGTSAVLTAAGTMLTTRLLLSRRPIAAVGARE